MNTTANTTSPHAYVSDIHHRSFDFCTSQQHDGCVLDQLDLLLLLGYIAIFIIGSLGNCIVLKIFHKPSRNGEIVGTRDIFFLLLPLSDHIMAH